MYIFHLKSRVGWGNEINIRTKIGTYAGSGRCCLNNSPFGIVHRKPTIEELLKDVTVSGFSRHPYVQNGDILKYELDNGEEISFKFKNIRYQSDPSDMFFGDLKLIQKKVSIISRIKNIFKSKDRINTTK